MANSLTLALAGASDQAECKVMLNALTIDVEEYFQATNLNGRVPRSRWDLQESRIESNTQWLLELLTECGVRGTFFILGWVAQRHPNMVRNIQREGHEIASLGYGHDLLGELTPEEFRADLRRSRRLLEEIAGKPVTLYRAPGFSVGPRTLWALDVLIEEGYTLDSSTCPFRHNGYGIPGAPLEPYRMERESGHIWEFPLPVCHVLGWPLPLGGASFRLYPYALTRRALLSINAQGRPFSFYLRPWEIDPDQPRLRPALLGGYRHYVGLQRSADRLEQLFRDFTFGTLSQAMDRLGQETLLPTHSFSRAA